jgi:hypothetical protein
MTNRLRTHVVLRVGDGDTYMPTLARNDRTLVFALQSPSAPARSRIADSIWHSLDEHGLRPSTPAIDFYRMAAAVYSADARILREKSFDRWTRDVVLHLPVNDVTRWKGVAPTLVHLLQFLTGDRWEVRVREGAPPRPPVDRRRADRAAVLDIDAVSLLSGGLDSFVGALDAFHDGQKLILVSHNATGPARFSSPAQTAVLSAVSSVAQRQVPHLKMTVSPPARVGSGESETSQRSRSIIFVGLGVLVASAYPSGTPLIVAENGFISLNVPLTHGRLGSHSTRTTHPYTFALVREVIAGLGLATPLVTPYQFMTKGEMLVNAPSQSVLAGAIHETNSCARPNERNAQASRPQAHCGYCVPCIVRRAAMFHAGFDDVRRYRYDVHAERTTLLASPDRRKDLWAFEMALARADVRATVTDVLRGGPLPPNERDISGFVDVYRCGMNEISEFLRGRPLS